MELRGSNFILRPYTESDIEPLVDAANNVNIARTMGLVFPYPYTLDDARFWVDQCAKAPENDLRLTIDIEGKVAGGVGLRPHHAWSLHTYEIGYWLAEPLWGRGIVTEAAGMLTQHGFEVIGAERIQAFVFDRNPGSMRVLEKNGYVREGCFRHATCRDGAWGDVLIYGRIR